MPIVTCRHCNVEFEKAQKNMYKSTTHFCSRSCSNSYNNHKFPRRTKSGKCKICSAAIGAARTYCHECWHTQKPLGREWESVTLGQIKLTAKYQAHAVVRQLARSIYFRSGSPTCCFICGYSLHIDVCHKKSIASFSDDDLVSRINDIENLVALCKNHHWEFDSGFLSLDVPPPLS